MPWKEHGVMDERFQLVQEWKSGDWSMAELGRFYGVTRVTGYKWVERYEHGGLQALGFITSPAAAPQ
jgi:transposase-like protein